MKLKNLFLLLGFMLFAVSTPVLAQTTVTISGTAYTCPGLVAWYHADALALSDQAAVSSWTDSSGNGNALVQATGGSQPIYCASEFGTQPGINFSSGKTLAGAITDAGATSTGTLYVVYRLWGTNRWAWRLAGKDAEISLAHTYRQVMVGTGSSGTLTQFGTGPLGRDDDVGVFSASYDGTNWVIDDTCDTLAHQGTGNGTGNLTTAQATNYLGRDNAGGSFDGAIAEIIECDQAATLSQMHAIRNALITKYSIPVYGQLCFEGDSLTLGTGADGVGGELAVQAQGLTKRRYALYNYGHSGSGTAGISTSATTECDPFYDAERPRNVCVWWSGANDYVAGVAATIESAIQTACQARKIAGYQVVVCTIISRGNSNAGAEIVRQAVNTWLRANYLSFSDALADYAWTKLDGTVAAGGTGAFFDSLANCSNQGIYYNGDAQKTHLLNPGYRALASVCAKAIDSLEPSTGGTIGRGRGLN